MVAMTLPAPTGLEPTARQISASPAIVVARAASPAMVQLLAVPVILADGYAKYDAYPAQIGRKIGRLGGVFQDAPERMDALAVVSLQGVFVVYEIQCDDTQHGSFTSIEIYGQPEQLHGRFGGLAWW